MSMHTEMGALLSEVRERAGLTQSEIAKRLKTHQSKVSRIESGEGGASREEYFSYLGLIHSDEAKHLRRVLNVDWKHLPRPSLRHPDLDVLIEIEKALQRLDKFKSGDDAPRVLVGQAEMLFQRLWGFGDFLLNLNHSVGYVGDIGVGKTTAACRQAGLVLSPTTPADLKGVIFDTGGGRVTLCEVSVKRGGRVSIQVEPLSDEEVYRLVAEFSRSLREGSDGKSAAQADFKLPEETERALRNMSGLARSRKKVDGKVVAIDPAADLARKFPSTDELRAEIASRLTLWRRTRKTIEFEGADESAGRQWLKDTFAAINNGRHTEFSLPERITVTTPFAPYPDTPFEVDLIDTRGVDGSAIRPDIVAQLKNRRTVTVLCSRFNSAPDASLQGLLKHIGETEVDPTLSSRVILLVLARPGESLAMREDGGAAAEDSAHGYEIKQGQVEDALGKLGLDGISVRFFDSSGDDASELTRELVGKVGALRKVQADAALAAVGAVDQMLANVQKAQALAALKEINSELSIFASRHRNLKEKRKPVHVRLLNALMTHHPRTVWAATRRSGQFWNFNVYQHLGDGAAADAKRRSASAIHGLREIIKNKLADNSLKTTHSFLEQLLDNSDSWEADFVEAARHHAVETYRPHLSSAQDLWSMCDGMYGQGLEYRNEVTVRLESWFEGSGELEEKMERLLQKAWRTTFLQPLRKAAGEALFDEPEVT